MLDCPPPPLSAPLTPFDAFPLVPLQGVDAAALAMADTKPTAAAVNLDTAGEGAAGTDVLAAFNKERTRLADEDDPHM